MSVAQKTRIFHGPGLFPQGSLCLTRPALIFYFIFNMLQETAVIADDPFDNRTRGFGMARPAKMIEF